MTYQDKDGKYLGNRLAVCRYFVKVHHEACHEADEVRFAALCQQFGVTEHVAPVQPTPTAEEIAATLQSRLTQIQQGRRRWLDENIDPDGLISALMLYQSGDEKAAAIFNWCVTLGTQSELRQSQLEAGLIEWDEALCDFSMYPKPHTNAEMMARAGLL